MSGELTTTTGNGPWRATWRDGRVVALELWVRGGEGVGGTMGYICLKDPELLTAFDRAVLDACSE